MTKTQIVLVVGAVILVWGLYQLPRVVVENETDTAVESHDFSVSQEDEQAIASLKGKLTENDSENYFNFADSLARYYLKYGLIDSAASVSRRSLLRDSSFTNLVKVGSVLYSVFERATTSESIRLYGGESRKVLEKISDQYPENPEWKTKLAMTIVATENPMVGVAMLQEVVDRDPDYREALVNLGLLSIQSGQYDKGIERFYRLLEKDSTDYEVMLYLGICYLETDQNEEAKEIFKNVAESSDADPALRMTAQEYLEQ